jgi:hypothetical protein
MAFQFHNTYHGWTNQCNYYKNARTNRLWQLDFWMKPKNFEVRYPHWQTSMKVTLPDTPGKLLLFLSKLKIFHDLLNEDSFRITWSLIICSLSPIKNYFIA